MNALKLERCVTTRAAAKVLGISCRRVRRLIHKGPLPAYRAEGRLWIRPDDLQAFLVQTFRTFLGAPTLVR